MRTESAVFPTPVGPSRMTSVGNFILFKGDDFSDKRTNRIELINVRMLVQKTAVEISMVTRLSRKGESDDVVLIAV